MTEYLRKDTGLISERARVVDPNAIETETITERTLERDTADHALITPPRTNVSAANVGSNRRLASRSRAHVRKKGSPYLSRTNRTSCVVVGTEFRWDSLTNRVRP